MTRSELCVYLTNSIWSYHNSYKLINKLYGTKNAMIVGGVRIKMRRNFSLRFAFEVRS